MQFKLTAASKQVDTLLKKKVNRKQFIKHVGVGAVAVTGVASALAALDSVQSTQQVAGYGGGAYGGDRRPAA